MLKTAILTGQFTNWLRIGRKYEPRQLRIRPGDEYADNYIGRPDSKQFWNIPDRTTLLEIDLITEGPRKLF